MYDVILFLLVVIILQQYIEIHTQQNDATFFIRVQMLSYTYFEICWFFLHLQTMKQCHYPPCNDWYYEIIIQYWR